MAYLGLIAGVALLIWLALRGVNIIFSSLLCSVLIILTNGLPIATGITEYYSFGPLGAFTFAGKFFLLFCAGAIFGRVMAESHAAASIALALVRQFGASRALVVTAIACALLTYGGVVIFVVIFAMYPLGLKLLQQADTPKRLFCAALALGGGTFTLTALPGTPSILNVIAATSLGTDLFAGGWLGILGSFIMLGGGLWYLERQRLSAIAQGDHFVPGPNDRIAEMPDHAYPHWSLATLPLVAVLSTIILPRVATALLGAKAVAQGDGLYALLRFANSELVVWPSLALLVGTGLALLLLPGMRSRALHVLGDGTQDAVIPLINTAAVIGFGGVVTHTVGFEQFVALMTGSGMSPLVSSFLSVSLVAAITGSSTGGLQIFMQTMAPGYVAQGMEPEVLHRLAAMVSGGFDSLPHCGAIVAMLSITGLTHKEAYRDVGVITVVIPVLATLVVYAVVALIY